VLDSLLQRGPWSAGLALGDLARRWDQVVGDALAAATEPVRLQDGVLSVRASTQAWAAQVRFLAPTVRARANEALGRSLVQDVRVFVGEGSRG
jgi:predicted nucleic acid-binding Zn ribbon protein